MEQSADMLKSQNDDLEECTGDYEEMSCTKHSGCPDDMYVSMLGGKPEYEDDLCNYSLYLIHFVHLIPNDNVEQGLKRCDLMILPVDEKMNAVVENPEDAMLRTFFQGEQPLKK